MKRKEPGVGSFISVLSPRLASYSQLQILIQAPAPVVEAALARMNIVNWDE